MLKQGLIKEAYVYNNHVNLGSENNLTGQCAKVPSSTESPRGDVLPFFFSFFLKKKKNSIDYQFVFNNLKMRWKQELSLLFLKKLEK